MGAMSFRSLAPSLLLAAPRLGDPNFERTVVLLGMHSEEGALGWIVNGAELPPVGELLKSADLVPGGVEVPTTPAFSRPARMGGPVAQETGWLIYTREQATFPRQIDVGERLVVTGDSDALTAVISGAEPFDFHLLLGYAGWGPGQLEEELRQGTWLPTAVEPSLLFPGTEAKPESLWEEAYRAATGGVANPFAGGQWGSA